jgi:mono/diheme cytochrome c family protein
METNMKHVMSTLSAIASLTLVASMSTVIANDGATVKANEGGAGKVAERTTVKAGRIARGKYLVTISACHDCHSPKADARMNLDESRLLSGRPATSAPPVQNTSEIRASLDLTAWAGPWGNSYAANLTPDPETGLGGRYTEELFIRTIRTGRKPEGEQLAPPMPWMVYRHMTDEDLKSIFAYLQTLKPVWNAVRASPKVAFAQP